MRIKVMGSNMFILLREYQFTYFSNLLRRCRGSSTERYSCETCFSRREADIYCFWKVDLWNPPAHDCTQWVIKTLFLFSYWFSSHTQTELMRSWRHFLTTCQLKCFLNKSNTKPLHMKLIFFSLADKISISMRCKCTCTCLLFRQIFA